MLRFSMNSLARLGRVKSETMLYRRPNFIYPVEFALGGLIQVREGSGGPRRPNRQLRGPSSPATGSSNMLGKAASVGLAGSFLMGKGKYVFAGLKLFKATPLLSMIATSFTYSLFFGWPYAIGMVGQIFIHETGHLVVLRHYGVPFSPMVMIPFLGASIQMDGHPRNAWQEVTNPNLNPNSNPNSYPDPNSDPNSDREKAMIAFGGPVAGGATAFGVMAAANATDSQLLYSLADFGFMINLFNCLPVGQMDGGRIANAISPYFSGAGLAVGGYMAYAGMIGNPIFYLILLAGAYDTTSRAMGWSERPRGYYQIGAARQGVLLAGLAVLIATLLMGMKMNDRKRKTPRQLEREQRYGVYDDEPAPWANDEGAKFDDFFDEGGPRSGRF